MTVRSTISRSLFARSQRVTCSPRSSRSLAFVAENTFTPVNIRLPRSLAWRAIVPSPSVDVKRAGLRQAPATPTVGSAGRTRRGAGMPTGRGEDARRKRELAIEFIRRIRAMERDRLHSLILREAGEDLAQFFLAYATELMQREPQRAVENASSLLLIGYLIRAFETEEFAQADEPRTALLH